jgi:hypothetical protein
MLRQQFEAIFLCDSLAGGNFGEKMTAFRNMYYFNSLTVLTFDSSRSSSL